MVNSPSFDKSGLNKRAWTQEEDKKLVDYVTRYGHWNWNLLPKFAGLARSGKSCRFRWMNYLRPNIKRGNYTKEEEETIIKLHQLLGTRWSAIASQMPGRTDNEIKNYWHSYLKKRFQQSSVTKPQISNSKDHLKDRQIKLKKRFQHALVIEAQNTMSKDHSPVVEPIVNNIIGDACPFPQHSSMSGSSSLSSEYTTVANNGNMNLEDAFAFLDVDTYPLSANFLLNSHMPNISHVPSELECFSPVNSVTEAVSPTANNIIMGSFQSHDSTELANSCPFPQQSSLSESSSTNTKYTTAANKEYMDSEDELAFWDTDTYPMSGNFWLEPYNMIDISYVPSEFEYFSQVKSVTKDHFLVELTADDTIGPFQSHRTTHLVNSCPFPHHSSLSESSSTSATYTTVANYENMDLENEFAFPDADINHMGGDLLLEPCMLEISHVPSALENFSPVNSGTEEAQVSKSKDHSAMDLTPNNIIGAFQSHRTIQLADSWAFLEHSSLSESSSTDANFTTVTNNKNMVLDVEDEFAFLDSDIYPMSENLWLKPYMLDISYLPCEPEYFNPILDAVAEFDQLF